MGYYHSSFVQQLHEIGQSESYALGWSLGRQDAVADLVPSQVQPIKVNDILNSLKIMIIPLWNQWLLGDVTGFNNMEHRALYPWKLENFDFQMWPRNYHGSHFFLWLAHSSEINTLDYQQWNFSKMSVPYKKSSSIEKLKEVIGQGIRSKAPRKKSPDKSHRSISQRSKSLPG